jgi:hypothetical protein
MLQDRPDYDCKLFICIMTNTLQLKSSSTCLDNKEMRLTPLEQYAAWNIIRNEQGVLRMGRYFYIGMKKPAPLPSA